MALLITAAVLFLPAGTLVYWQGWVYLAILFAPMIFAMRYLFKYEPELLERRMRLKEKEPKQAKLMKFSTLFFLFFFIISALDRRYQWSAVPLIVVVAAEIMVLAGYLLCLLVFKKNPYASRIIEVVPDQEVVTTGLYARVRHPMYLGVLLLYFFTPLALGSAWAMLLTPLLLVFLVVRILGEEELLMRKLKGYPEYTQKTRYRLIPGVW